MTIGFRIRLPVVEWNEPAAYYLRYREDRLLPRWYTFVVGTGIVFAVCIALWFFRAVAIPGVQGLIVCLVAAATVSLFLFVLFPLVSLSRGSRVQVWPPGAAWRWGTNRGSIAFRRVESFRWVEEGTYFVLLLFRQDGAPPFEVAVSEDDIRDWVTNLLVAKGIPQKGANPSVAQENALSYNVN